MPQQKMFRIYKNIHTPKLFYNQIYVFKLEFM